jgi:Arylsulfotransferase (ASST)
MSDGARRGDKCQRGLQPRQRSGSAARGNRAGVFSALAIATVTLATAACGATLAMAPAAPPTFTVLTNAGVSRGDIFTADFGPPSGYGTGPEIISTTGRLIWYHPVPAGARVTDFRTQTYLGQQVLTWSQQRSFGGTATDYIYNDHYQQIATVKAADGASADMHEFLITPWNTALITATTTTTANLTAIGGPRDQAVTDGIVQEIDIRTGKVLFQWNSAGHVPYGDSHLPLPPKADEAWDWFHLNAVHLGPSGNLVISSRYTWAVYDVNRRTGRVLWQLGGKHSSFTEKAAPGQVLDKAGEIFAFQHDPAAVGKDVYTVFDDESDGISELPYSRAVTIRLNFRTHVATLVKSEKQPEGLGTSAFGSVQTTGNGDQFVGWGEAPYISEFGPSGRLLFNAKFPSDAFTYRAYLLPWHPAG